MMQVRLIVHPKCSGDPWALAIIQFTGTAIGSPRREREEKDKGCGLTGDRDTAAAV